MAAPLSVDWHLQQLVPSACPRHVSLLAPCHGSPLDGPCPVGRRPAACPYLPFWHMRTSSAPALACAGCPPCCVYRPAPQKYEEMKADAVRVERHMLRAFGFVVHVEHPHRFILNYCQLLALGWVP